MRQTIFATALIALIGPAFAQAPAGGAAGGGAAGGAAGAGVAETVEQLANETEAAGVRATLERIGCEAEEIEKESNNLFEIDDAECEIGQYDIKLDAEFNIVSMTRDE